MFPGFPSEAVAFLRSLSRNNRREWFQPRKEIFDTKVKAPMIDLVEALNAELLKFAPDYINDPKKAIYRIYRDTRFSSDKTPYKTHIAAIFPRRGLDRTSGAGFYFHISPKDVSVACGAYMPGPDELRAIRAWLAEHHADFRKAEQSAKKLMGDLQGESLRRVPKGFDAGHPAAGLIRMKQWYHGVELDVKLAESPQLLPEIVKRFRALAGVVEMLNAGLVKVGQNPLAHARGYK